MQTFVELVTDAVLYFICMWIQKPFHSFSSSLMYLKVYDRVRKDDRLKTGRGRVARGVEIKGK